MSERIYNKPDMKQIIAEALVKTSILPIELDIPPYQPEEPTQ